MIFWIGLILYASILLELMLLHVPSVANTQVFFKKKKSYTDYPTYGYIFDWSLTKKIVLLAIPHIINMVAIILPLVYLIVGKYSVGLIAWVGIGIALIGRLFTIVATLRIRKMNSQIGDDFTLHTDGPFAISRNPILVGMYIFYWGMAIVVLEWPVYLAGLFYMGYSHFKVLIEEDFLKVKFQDFNEYLTKSKRYL